MPIIVFDQKRKKNHLQGDFNERGLILRYISLHSIVSRQEEKQRVMSVTSMNMPHHLFTGYPFQGKLFDAFCSTFRERPNFHTVQFFARR